MPFKAPDIEEALAYYSASEWATCACTLIRKFGVQGGASFLQQIETMLKAIDAIMKQTDRMLQMFDRLDSMTVALQPQNLLNTEFYKYMSNVNICTALNQLLTDIGDQLLSQFRGGEMSSYLTDKHKMLKGHYETFKGKIELWLLQLQRMRNFMQLMEGCATTALSSGRNLQNDLKAQDVASKPQVGEIPITVLGWKISGNMIKIVDDVWFVWSDDGVVKIRRKVNNIWLADVIMETGSYPTIAYAAPDVTVHFTESGQLFKLVFQPQDIETPGLPISVATVGVKDLEFWNGFYVARNLNCWELYEGTTKVVDAGIDTVPMQGINVVGVGADFVVVVSVRGFLNFIKVNAVGAMLQYGDICPGSYPRMFWNVSQNLGLLVYLNNKNELVGRFTTDWLDYKSEVQIGLILRNTQLAEGFMGIWAGAETLNIVEWEQIYRDVNVAGLNSGYLNV